MIRYRYVATSAVLLAAIGIGPVRAQAVVEEPGYCAQSYPSANCNNYGPGNPLYPGSYQPAAPYVGYPGPYAAVAPVAVHRHRRQHYRY